jgi:hypothetical protein
MELLRGGDRCQYFNQADFLRFSDSERDWREGNAGLRRSADRAIIVLRKRDVPARSVVLVFQDLRLTRPHRIIGIPVRRHPHPHEDELEGKEGNKEYSAALQTHCCNDREKEQLKSNSHPCRRVPKQASLKPA